MNRDLESSSQRSDDSSTWDSAGRNVDAKIAGQRIDDGYKAGTLDYTFMGPTGGGDVCVDCT